MLKTAITKNHKSFTNLSEIVIEIDDYFVDN